MVWKISLLLLERLHIRQVLQHVSVIVIDDYVVHRSSLPLTLSIRLLALDWFL